MMKVIKTNKAPCAIGPYSQAIVSNGFIFTSGQIGIDRSTNEVISKDIESEIKQVIANLDQVLIEGGSSLSRIVKLNVYLKDLSHFDILNKVFKEKFNNKKYPARSTLEVSKLPKNVNVEIDAIAVVQK